MKLLLLLQKIFIIPFYQRNTSFFLFFFFLFFGAVSPGSLISFHLSLLQSILASYVTLTGVLFCWLLYTYKCINFFRATLTNKKGEFLFQLQTLSFQRQFLLFTLVQLSLLLPVLVYIGVVINMALQQHQILQALLLFTFSLVICCGSGTYYTTLINRTWIVNKPWFTLPLFSLIRPKRFLFYILHFTWYKKKRQLLVLKLLSIILFYIAMVWNGDRFDHDTLVLFLLLLLLVHSLLAFDYVQLIERNLLFIRNLPLASTRIFAAYYITFAILFLPELIYTNIVGYTLLSTQQLIALYFSFVHTLMLFTTVQYSGTIDRKEYVKIIFGISFVSIFFFNGEHYAIWSILVLITSAILFFSSYHQYEP